MDTEGISLPMFHKHLMVPWNGWKKGRCCQRFETISDGYYCQKCDVFIHKKCVEAPAYIQHPSHSAHILRRQSKSDHPCDLCGTNMDLCYRCEICDFNIDLGCATYPTPVFIDIPMRHQHKLTLLKELTEFDCDAKCARSGYGYPYQCHECSIAFHVECVFDQRGQSRLELCTLEVKHPLEVNHSHHSLHPLKVLVGQPPDYSDRKCRLCGKEIDDNYFYHCSSCKFSLDMVCVFHPPPQTLLDLKTHDHQLTLLPRLISFTCNACGLKGDRSPYICVQCDFVIHQDCVGLPRVININRHDHRISRISLIGVVNTVCGVCREKVDWSCGGYSCQRCPSYVVHSKCATRKDVWNGKELEGVPEEIEDIEPYVVIDANTIQHFSHIQHYLRFNVNSLLWEDNKWCNACTYPIAVHSFYGCMDCDFFLHENCAQLPKKKRHMLHNDQLSLVTNKVNDFWCHGCHKRSNGFRYEDGRIKLDVSCGSISEPLVHPSHPHHLLYYIPANDDGICNGCNRSEFVMFRCIEDSCEFVLGFECAVFPQVVKHRVDDFPLSLYYGEEANGKLWCDICEEKTNPKTWFYTCKDHRASMHIECVLGESYGFGFLPKSIITAQNITYEVVLNRSATRPICQMCENRCTHSIILKMLGASGTYWCSQCCHLRFF